MKLAVLGTGMVGRALAARLADLDHDVVVGTRDVDATFARDEPDAMGNPPFAQWHAEHGNVRLVTFADAGKHGEVIVNATAGAASIAALDAVGADNLAGKVLVDVANPLDFSQGLPPRVSATSSDSLAEQIQRAFPAARVVKTLNTMNAYVMVDPSRIPGGHTVFVAGDDEDAKTTVKRLLGDFGWSGDAILDLGGLPAARGAEMYLPLWLSVWATLGTGDFNIKVVRA